VSTKREMSRKILHVDLDAFFCSVEIIKNPELEGRPFIVGGGPGARGVVASASYPARKFGIRSAMPTAQALRLCPDLIIVPPGSREYSEYSHDVMALLEESAPLIEQISIDEAFLDVSDAHESGEEIALRLQREITERFHLPTSWGVASNKLVAKIATEVGKPKGLVVVPAGQEAQFLSPLPVEMLWGIGPKTKEKLVEFNISTIGELAKIHTDQLHQLFGDRGVELAARAQGIDDRPVIESYTRRSISSERTFREDISDKIELRRNLLAMSEELGRRLRSEDLAGSTVRIKIRWPDFKTITRQVRLNQPTNQDREIFKNALDLLHTVWKDGQKIRLLGIAVADLGTQIRQLSLFDRTWEEDERLLEAIDRIRDKYGRHAVRRASSLKRGDQKRS
jgi:DNA polymerase-4